MSNYSGHRNTFTCDQCGKRVERGTHYVCKGSVVKVTSK